MSDNVRTDMDEVLESVVARVSQVGGQKELLMPSYGEPRASLNLSGRIELHGGTLAFTYDLPEDTIDNSLDKFMLSLYDLHGFVGTRIIPLIEDACEDLKDADKGTCTTD